VVSSRNAGFLFALTALASAPALAWEKHESLMPTVAQVIEEALAAPEFVAARVAFTRAYAAPCPEDDLAFYRKLSAELQLNPEGHLPPTATEACRRHEPTTGQAIVAGSAVDDPDLGMDEDLEGAVPGGLAAVDPDHFQKWMGGSTGPTSKGFRHMYFGGWQVWHPIHTFQIPAGAVGYAPERAALLAKKARELIWGTNPLWGFRLLAWAMHYVQDLSQPFHATQIPALEMVPWYALLHGFGDLVKETTRAISNYHWAYEDYTLYRLKEENSAELACLRAPERNASPDLRDDPYLAEMRADPRRLAERVAHASAQLAPRVGDAEYALFGASLRQSGMDLAHGQGKVDYADTSVRPDRVAERSALQAVTCEALGNAAWASRELALWALKK
jgi:hypothetical protein